MTSIEEVLGLTDSFVEVERRPIPKVPALRGKTVVSLFFEDSTRTRLCFETAAKRLSADTMTFSVGVVVGEEGRVAPRHRRDHRGHGRRRHRRAPRVGRGARAGRPLGRRRRSSTPATAGTSTRPRRCSTATRSASHLGVARRAAQSPSSATSSTAGWPAPTSPPSPRSGAEVTLVAPPTLLPPEPRRLAGRRSATTSTRCCPSVDVVYLLRMQRERMTEALLPSLREYTARYGLDRPPGRRCCADDALVMHPGPMNRGVEIAAEVADLPRRGDHRPGAQRRGRAHGGPVPAARLPAPTWNASTDRRRRQPDDRTEENR